MQQSLPLLAFLLVPFIGAALFLVLPKKSDRLPHLLTMGTTMVALALLTWLTLNNPAEQRFYVEWMRPIGLNFSLWLDGPALFFAWLVTGMGFLIFLYAGWYMDPKDSPWRFFGTMLLFMGAMLGVVISKNALLMFFFWELTSVSSFILIGHWHEKATARAGALQALIVTGAGGLCLMSGIAGWFWMMGGAAAGPDALEWDMIWANKGAITGTTASLVFMILVLLGGFTKSAQFPFHFWLPGAMEAPTPVSAYLHAATMVKAGIYLFGRLYPIYADEPMWLFLLGTAGTVTMLIGGFMALLSNDLKQLLAHSTVSQLGLITAYYGFGHGLVETDHKLPLDLLLIASHAFFKGALFMLVGIIDHGAHTREWKRLGGLLKVMPITAVLTMIGCASMAGVPLTFGFVAKELFLKASLDLHTDLGIFKYGLPALAIFASIFTAAYCYRMAISPFFGKPRDPEVHAHEGGFLALFSPGLLIGLCLVGGLYVPLIEGPLSKLVNSEFYGLDSHFKFAFFHHVDKLLWIAVGLFSIGFAFFMVGGSFEKVYATINSPAPFRNTYRAIFDDGLPKFAKWLTNTVQSPSLSRNALLTFVALILFVGGAAFQSGAFPKIGLHWENPPVLAFGIVVLIAVSVMVMMTHRVSLIRLIALSPVGLLVAIYFLVYKAPDLALTQILVEVVTLLVILLLLFRLPQRIERPEKRSKLVIPAAVAIACGLIMGAITFIGSESTLRNQPTFEGWPTVSEYYVQNSKHPHELHEGDSAEYPGAANLRAGGGKNIVNVILVDFRGFDTLGEITVLGIAALGVFTLLLYNRDRRRSPEWRKERRAEVHSVVTFGGGPRQEPVVREAMWDGGSLILKELARIIPSLILVFAFVLFMAGHNAPGGGFIAGLMASVALAVLFISFRKSEIPELYNFKFMQLIPIGLLFAVGTGLVAIALGLPFLTSGYTYIDIPFIGNSEVASAMAFDLGVFLTVVGVTMLIIQKFGSEQ